jgi:hypothetical protein
VYTPVDLDNFNDIDDMMLMEDSRTLDSYGLADGDPKNVIFAFWEGDEPGDDDTDDDDESGEPQPQVDTITLTPEQFLSALEAADETEGEEDEDEGKDPEEDGFKKVLTFKSYTENFMFTTKKETADAPSEMFNIHYVDGCIVEVREILKFKGQKAISSKLREGKKLCFKQWKTWLYIKEVQMSDPDEMSFAEFIHSRSTRLSWRFE